MKIIYKPLFSSGDAIGLPDLDGMVLHPGVPSDDLSDTDAHYALGNPNFVDAATGENPYFVVNENGTVTPREGAPDRVAQPDSLVRPA